MKTYLLRQENKKRSQRRGKKREKREKLPAWWHRGHSISACNAASTAKSKMATRGPGILSMAKLCHTQKENEKQKMENEKQKMENEKRKMKNEK